MGIFEYANEVTAVIAVVLWMLVTRGFAPHMRMSGHDAGSLMRTCIVLTSAVVWWRLLYWDIARVLLGGGVQSASGQAVNTFFNCWAAGAAVLALGALHRSLPPEARKHYNWLTAPFYPGRCSAIWRIWK